MSVHFWDVAWEAFLEQSPDEDRRFTALLLSVAEGCNRIRMQRRLVAVLRRMAATKVDEKN